MDTSERYAINGGYNRMKQLGDKHMHDNADLELNHLMP
jgi:hypothetical protein